MDDSTAPTITATKTCSRCGEEKPATREFFYIRADGRGGGFQNPCKTCQKIQRDLGERFTDVHWQRAEIDIERGLRRCTKCLEWLPATRLFFSIGTLSPDGCFAQCKNCYSAAQRDQYAEDAEFNQKRREYSLAYHYANQDDPEYRLRRAFQALKSTYKLDEDGYWGMFIHQGGVCAVPGCGTAPEPGKLLWVDHDHACCPGKKSCGECVRGLVCERCNTTLGRVHDDPVLLRGLATYLLTWKSESINDGMIGSQLNE